MVNSTGTTTRKQSLRKLAGIRDLYGWRHESGTFEGVGLNQELCWSRSKVAISAERAPRKQSLWEQDQTTIDIAKQIPATTSNNQEDRVTSRVTGTIALIAP